MAEGVLWPIAGGALVAWPFSEVLIGCRAAIAHHAARRNRENTPAIGLRQILRIGHSSEGRTVHTHTGTHTHAHKWIYHNINNRQGAARCEDPKSHARNWKWQCKRAHNAPTRKFRKTQFELQNYEFEQTLLRNLLVFSLRSHSPAGWGSLLRGDA